MRVRDLTGFKCVVLLIAFCYCVYYCKYHKNESMVKHNNSVVALQTKNQSSNTHIDMKDLENRLHELGVVSRKHDVKTGADMAYSMKSDYPTAIMYIGMMVDKDGNPIADAQKCYKDLMDLSEEQRNIAVKYFIEGYSEIKQ